MTDKPRTLTVGILTFHRPEPLARCLRAVLDQLDSVVTSGLARSADVLVVDNDPASSARGIVDGFAGSRVRYCTEPQPGISAGRNRALRDAHADLLVFLDDDEVPRADWLRSILTTWQETRARAVMGRVEARFEGAPDPFVTAGHLFGRPRMASGTRIEVAAAGNLLLDLRWVNSHGLRFDERFGLSGGEDTMFSRELVAAGGSIVWCDESVADDFIPAERVTRHWLARRFWAHGNTTVAIEVVCAASLPVRAVVRVRAFLRGASRVTLGGLRYAVGMLTRSDRARSLGFRTAYRGAGMVAGSFGFRYEQYRRLATPRVGAGETS